MRRCCGRTKNLNRCGRIGDWRLFCDDHKMQPILAAYALVFTVVAGGASILSYLRVPPPVTIQNSNLEEPAESYKFDSLADGVDVAAKAEASHYRVRYLQFNDKRSFDALLKGKLKQEYPEVFEKEPFVIRTEAFDFLERLRPEIEDYDGGLRSKTFDISNVQRKFETDPNYFISNSRHYRFAENECRSQADYALGFVGAQNINDLAGKYKQLPQFLRTLSASNPDVPDLAMERFLLQECDCVWELQIAYRPLKVVVLDVENVSQQPLRMSYIEGDFRQSPDMHLSPFSSNAQRQGERKRLEFPQELLAPGEHILVPMGLLLSSFTDLNISPHPESIPRQMPAASLVIQEETSDEKEQSVSHPDKKREVEYHNEYVVGSWFSPRLAAGLGAVRPFSPSNVVYQGSLEQGSCPYLFAYVPSRRQWVRSGTVISNKKGKESEGESSLRISRETDGRILVKEVEPETSYLDQIYLKVELEGGEQIILFPDDRRLRLQDADYVILNQGQEILLEFALPSKPLKSVRVISRGYFTTESAN